MSQELGQGAGGGCPVPLSPCPLSASVLSLPTSTFSPSFLHLSLSPSCNPQAFHEEKNGGEDVRAPHPHGCHSVSHPRGLEEEETGHTHRGPAGTPASHAGLCLSPSCLRLGDSGHHPQSTTTSRFFRPCQYCLWWGSPSTPIPSAFALFLYPEWRFIFNIYYLRRGLCVGGRWGPMSGSDPSHLPPP